MENVGITRNIMHEHRENAIKQERKNEPIDEEKEAYEGLKEVVNEEKPLINSYLKAFLWNH